MALFGAFLFGFGPMLLFAAFVNWLDRYEKEPKMLLGSAFVWGAVIAGGGAFVLNTAFGIGVYVLTGSETATDFTTASIIAPVIEELLKGLAVGVVFLFFYKEFDSILDGIVYGAVTALGFAAIENVLYIYRNGYQESGWEGFWTLVIVRVILVGWMHPFFTAFTGIGFALARLSKGVLRIIAIPAGYALAVITHAFHNTFGSLVGGAQGFFLGILVDYLGYILMVAFIVWMIMRERNGLKRYLMEELNNGLISLQQYKTAVSFFQVQAHLKALVAGNFKTTERFYQVLGELSHKKSQLERLGDESGNNKTIEQYRAELVKLAPLAET
ncbi:MAG TPA: PrsW family intramembrane metalloprotease [Anaerolineales bacterium]|nr:PrsW family intramembrane metalloprotease [Anaerolineales bacterium]